MWFLHVYINWGTTPCCLPGAPVIESSSGEYVAGNRVKRLGSTATVASSASFDEMNMDSYWRVEEHEARKKALAKPADLEGSKDPGDEAKVEPAKEAEVEATLEVPGTPNVEEKIPLGYSPSTAPSSVEPAASIPVKSNKFDKIYHQRLACI